MEYTNPDAPISDTQEALSYLFLLGDPAWMESKLVFKNPAEPYIAVLLSTSSGIGAAYVLLEPACAQALKEQGFVSTLSEVDQTFLINPDGMQEVRKAT